MAEDLRRNINTNRVEILKNLDLEVIIVEELRSKYIISQEQAETLLDETIPYRRNSLFIRYLERKGASQIKEFCGVLQNYRQEHVCQMITESGPTTSVSNETSDGIFKNFVKCMYAPQEKEEPEDVETTDGHTKEKQTSERLKNLSDDTDQGSHKHVWARVGQALAKIGDELNALYDYKRSMETDPYRMSDLDLIILAGLVTAKVITEEQAAVVAEHKKLNLFKCSFAYISGEEKNNFMNKLQKTLLLQDNEKQDSTHTCPDTEKVKEQDSKISTDIQDDIKHNNSMKQAREIVKEDIIEKEATFTDTQQKPVFPLMKDIDLNALCATVLSRAKRVVMHGPRDTESVLSALAAEWASITEDIVVLDNPIQHEMKVSEYLKKFELTVTLDIENNQNKSLHEIILQNHPRLRNVDNVMSLIEKNQCKVLFLIKGYDKSKLDENSDLQKLLNREILPEATCIVSTTDQFPGYKTSWSDKEVLVEEYLHKHTIPDEENHPVWMKPKKSSKEYIQNCCIEDIKESHKNRVSSLKQGQQTMKLYEVCFSGTPSRVLTVDPVQATLKALFIDTVAVDWALFWQFMKQGKPLETMLDKALEHLLNYEICMTIDLHEVTSDQTLVDIIKSQHPKFEELEDLEEFLEKNQNKTLFLVKGFNYYITNGMFNSDIKKLFEKTLLPDVVCVLAYRGKVRRSAFHWGRCVQLTEDQVDVCRSHGKGRKRRSDGPVFCAVQLDAKKPRN